MNLDRSDLWSLEEYAEKRPTFRDTVIEHKKDRYVHFGNHITLIFEDTLTIRYQIQEMLRIERVFEAAGIQDELDAYNPLIPDGDNWKCTLMIHFDDVDERRTRLQELLGVEDKIWMQVGDGARIYPVADEDMDRSNDEKTSAVHFLRYQLDAASVAAAKAGADIKAGIDHEGYPMDDFNIPQVSRDSLTADLT